MDLDRPVPRHGRCLDEHAMQLQAQISLSKRLIRRLSCADSMKQWSSLLFDLPFGIGTDD